MAVAFNAGTLGDIAACKLHVQSQLNRGTLSATSKPTATEVENWIIRAKQELIEVHNFTWTRVFAYLDTVVDTYRYALPLDYEEGGYVLRDLTQNLRVTPIDPVSFDSLFPDVAGDSTSAPTYYTIKDRELWFSQPTSGVYRLELEYMRSGDDSTPTDISFIPELMRFRLCDYATYRSFIVLQQWEAASAYKVEWEAVARRSKNRDNKKRWAALGYKARPWLV